MDGVSYLEPASTYSPTEEKWPGVFSVATRRPLGSVVIRTSGSDDVGLSGKWNDLFNLGRRWADVRREWTAARRMVVVGREDSWTLSRRWKSSGGDYVVRAHAHD